MGLELLQDWDNAVFDPKFVACVFLFCSLSVVSLDVNDEVVVVIIITPMVGV